ncbi:hypothetical protein [Novosphingobium barchaimii]|nr:hypothetical protein [Novosphingobium barchaimii]
MPRRNGSPAQAQKQPCQTISQAEPALSSHWRIATTGSGRSRMIAA